MSGKKTGSLKKNRYLEFWYFLGNFGLENPNIVTTDHYKAAKTTSGHKNADFAKN